jgi:hypothetical protein
MIMTKIVDDRIALVKIIVKYCLTEEEVSLESTITPFTYSSKYELQDQYDFIGIATQMIDVDIEELDVDDYIAFQDTLDIKVMIDDRNIVNLN